MTAPQCRQSASGTLPDLLQAAVEGLLAAADGAGAAPARVAALRRELASGRLFPLPVRDGGEPARPRSAQWPAGGIYPAADGWLVAGPTRLPTATLVGLLGLDPQTPRDRLAEQLAEWTCARSREHGAATLQSWRTYFTPVLEPVEAAACLASEAGSLGPDPARRGRTRPLDGELILDLTHLWAGPLSTRLLVDLGAVVVKVEGPRRPDPLRLAAAAESQPCFDALNRGKLSLSLDLGRERGRECLLRALAVADGVVDNFSPRAWANWGLDPARLAPELGLNWVTLSAFAATGPYAGFGAFGAGVEGTSGHASLHARGGTPRLLGAPLADPLMGLEATRTYLVAGRGYTELSQNAILAESVTKIGGTHHSLPRLAPIVPDRGPRAPALGEDSAVLEDRFAWASGASQGGEGRRG